MLTDSELFKLQASIQPNMTFLGRCLIANRIFHAAFAQPRLCHLSQIPVDSGSSELVRRRENPSKTRLPKVLRRPPAGSESELLRIQHRSFQDGNSVSNGPSAIEPKQEGSAPACSFDSRSACSGRTAKQRLHIHSEDLSLVC